MKSNSVGEEAIVNFTNAELERLSFSFYSNRNRQFLLPIGAYFECLFSTETEPFKMGSSSTLVT